MYVPAYAVRYSSSFIISIPSDISMPKNDFVLWYYKHLDLFVLIGLILILLGIFGLLFYK